MRSAKTIVVWSDFKQFCNNSKKNSPQNVANKTISILSTVCVCSASFFYFILLLILFFANIISCLWKHQMQLKEDSGFENLNPPSHNSAPSNYSFDVTYHSVEDNVPDTLSIFGQWASCPMIRVDRLVLQIQPILQSCDYTFIQIYFIIPSCLYTQIL